MGIDPRGGIPGQSSKKRPFFKEIQPVWQAGFDFSVHNQSQFAAAYSGFSPFWPILTYVAVVEALILVLPLCNILNRHSNSAIILAQFLRRLGADRSLNNCMIIRYNDLTKYDGEIIFWFFKESQTNLDTIRNLLLIG